MKPHPIIAKLRGRSFAEIREILTKTSRDELIVIVAALATIEPLFKPSEIRALVHRRQRDILADIKAGKFGDYFCFGPNSLAVPTSGVNAWLARFRVRAAGTEAK